jgi:hypothetical protein
MADVPEHCQEIMTELGALAHSLVAVNMTPQAKEVQQMRVRLEQIAASYPAMAEYRSRDE